MEKAIFGGGCFWCTEAIYKHIKGVTQVLPGYSGGHTQNHTSEEVYTGTTGHAEVVYIEYDPELVTYRTLLTIFFASHNPTTLNQQGADIGTQYRSVILYTTEEQKKIAEDMIVELNESSKFGDPIVTEVVPFSTFYVAEDYHQNFFKNNQSSAYCQVVINPKLEKLQKEFASLIQE